MFNDARTSLEIRAAADSGWKIRLLSVLIIVFFMTIIAAYVFGKYRAEVEWQQAIEALDVLESDFTAIALENEKLKESLEFEKAKTSRDLQIKRQAYDEVALTLASTSREISSLRENIRFYESIIEGDEKKNPFHCSQMEL